MIEPTSWKIAPKGSTDAMMEAGAAVLYQEGSGAAGFEVAKRQAARVWSAMLRVAPEPPAGTMCEEPGPGTEGRDDRG